MKKNSFALMMALILPLMVLSVNVGCTKTEDATVAPSTDAGDGGGGGGGGGGGATSKSLYSRWYVTNLAWSVDFTGGNAAGTPFNGQIIQSDGTTICDCSFTLTGDESGGTCTVNSCTWNNSGSDPDCNDSGHGGSPGSGFGVCNGGVYTNNGTNLQWASGVYYH